MYKKRFSYGLLLLILPLLTACDNKNSWKQPEVLGKKSNFDLEKIEFTENVYQLFSNVLMVNNWEYEPTEGKPDIEKLDFITIESVTANLRIPKEKYGYLFKSTTNDSIARLGDFYFNTIEMLTKRDTSLVAVYASGGYITEEAALDSAMAYIFKKYGEPDFQDDLGQGFNIKAYEWNLNDRLLQIQTSNGSSVIFTTDSDEPVYKTYFRVDALVVKQNEIEGLVKACTYPYTELPDYEKHGINQDIINMGDFTIFTQLPQYRNITE